MIVYLIGTILTLIFVILAFRYKENRKIYITFAILSAIPLFFISAFRYDVGTDYFYRYAPNYMTFVYGGDVKNLELLFKLIIKICILFTESYLALFVVTSAMIIFPIFYLIYKKSKYPLLSIVLFLLGTFFFNSLNLVRQYISIVIILCSYSYLLEKKYIKWIACIIFASLFHKSALIGFLLFFLKNKKFFNPIFVLILIAFLFLFGNQLKDLLVFIISLTPYDNYVDSIYATSDIRESVIIVNIVIYILMYVLYQIKKKNNKITKTDLFFLNIQSMAVLMSVLSIQFNLLYRMVEYFTIFQIISIPHFLDLKKDYSKMILIVLLMLYSVNFYHLYIRGNVNEVFPYRFIFDKGRLYE